MARQSYTGPPADLQNVADTGNRLTAICQGCWHVGPTRTPEGWASVFRVPMTTPVIALKLRLKCNRCGARNAYFHLENGMVNGRGD